MLDLFMQLAHMDTYGDSQNAILRVLCSPRLHEATEPCAKKSATTYTALDWRDCIVNIHTPECIKTQYRTRESVHIRVHAWSPSVPLSTQQLH